MRHRPTDGTRYVTDGLRSDEAARRLSSDGPNEIASQRPRGLLRIGLEVLTEPMFLLLLSAAGVYLILGSVQEAVVLAASILIIIVITIAQERRTEHALAQLRDLSSPRALVIRDGVERRIAGRDVVAGDVIILREGDRVPADAVLHSATALSINESILTGESLPVEKYPVDTRRGDAQTHVYSGTLVVHGHGTAIVVATGERSELGKIGRTLHGLTTETTPLYREIRRVVRWAAIAAVLLCVLIAAVYASTRHDWLNGVLAGITMAMGLLPEELPVVLTVFLAMGAWRISRVGVLTRRMPAIESIGAVTVLAVDKTGTLTENRMRVALLESSKGSLDLRRGGDSDPASTAILAAALAASEQQAFDPMERAIHEAAARLAPAAVADLARMELIREYDLTPELLAVTHVWRTGAAGPYAVAVKGAPETVLGLCRIPPDARSALLKRVAHHAKDGLRVLGVATGEHAEAAMPADPLGFQLRFLGFICLADPLRNDVPDALRVCSNAGIRVAMMTGDHPGTAIAIAQQAGFDTSGGVLTGKDMATMSESALRERVRSINIFARMSPEQKLRLVQAFKANGEFIAMTGDGVNDAPALKAAHIGVAMGGRGTDVAREAADIVLVNDDFGSLVAAVRLGRRIYDNIRHAMTFIVAVHIPIAGLGLLPVVFGWPLLFFPVHVLFLEFIIDPACAFVFEADPQGTDAMQRGPRGPQARLFSADTLRRSVLLGGIALLLCLVVYATALTQLFESEARALTFATLVCTNLALIFVSRSRSQTFIAVATRHNRVFWWIVLITLAVLAVTLLSPPVAALFQFVAPPAPVVFPTLSTAILSILIAGRALRMPRSRGTAKS